MFSLVRARLLHKGVGSTWPGHCQGSPLAFPMGAQHRSGQTPDQPAHLAGWLTTSQACWPPALAPLLSRYEHPISSLDPGSSSKNNFPNASFWELARLILNALVSDQVSGNLKKGSEQARNERCESQTSGLSRWPLASSFCIPNVSSEQGCKVLFLHFLYNSMLIWANLG